MRLAHVLRCAVPACALALSACAAPHPLPSVAPSAAPTTFAIRLHRPQKPGDRGVVWTSVRSRRTTTVVEGDRTVKRETVDREIELEARVVVLAVDGAGTPTHLEYTIESLNVQSPEGRSEPLPRGSVIAAERGHERVTYRAVAPLSPEAQKAMDEVVGPRSSESTDDEVFGTAEPQGVGAIWPMNTALAAKSLAAAHLDVPAEAIRGQTHLVGLAEVAGRPCLEVAGELTIRDPRIIDLPDGRPESAELRSSYRKLVPIDTAAPEVDSTLRIDVDVALRVALGPNREGMMTVSSRKESRRRFLAAR